MAHPCGTRALATRSLRQATCEGSLTDIHEVKVAVHLNRETPHAPRHVRTLRRGCSQRLTSRLTRLRYGAERRRGLGCWNTGDDLVSGRSVTPTLWRCIIGEALDAAGRYYELFAAGDFEGATDCFDPDCITVTPAGAMGTTDHEQFGRAFKAALPDAHMVVDRAIESDDSVAIEGRFEGRHTADLVTPQGTIPPAVPISTCRSLTFSASAAAELSSIGCIGIR
jgi:hypothetical protein